MLPFYNYTHFPPSHLHKWNLHNIIFGIGFFIQHISLEIYPVMMCINSLFLFVHILFNHLPVEGHWVVFRFWRSQITIMSIHVQVFKKCSFSPSPCHIIFICSPWASSWIVNDSTTVFFTAQLVISHFQDNKRHSRMMKLFW